MKTSPDICAPMAMRLRPTPTTPQFTCHICRKTQAANKRERLIERHHGKTLSGQSRNVTEQPIQQIESVNIQDTSDEDDECCQETQTACEASTTRARQQIENRINELNAAQPYTLHSTRISMELPQYYEEMIKHVQPAYPITPRQ
jgi:hypothetical protein